ncbi:hypothetical protein HAT93_02714 [Dickeya solani]|nr:hypothetical protein [Dickeya solani]
MKFTEDTRVKIPTILHLMKLGYHYLSLKEQSWDKDTNIFPDIFTSAIARINPTTPLTILVACLKTSNSCWITKI